MKVILSKNFLKKYRKFKNIQDQVERRMALFAMAPFEKTLNNHPLSGNREGQRSINITGNYRAVYYPVDPETAHFIDLDNHNNLYK